MGQELLSAIVYRLCNRNGKKFTIQEPVDCEPSGGYDVVLVCDNVTGQTSTKCTYSQTISTQFSDSVSEGMSVDTTVQEEMEAMFWGLFR